MISCGYYSIYLVSENQILIDMLGTPNNKFFLNKLKKYRYLEQKKSPKLILNAVKYNLKYYECIIE